MTEESLAPFYRNRRRLPRKQRQHECSSKANRQLVKRNAPSSSGGTDLRISLEMERCALLIGFREAQSQSLLYLKCRSHSLIQTPPSWSCNLVLFFFPLTRYNHSSPNRWNPPITSRLSTTGLSASQPIRRMVDAFRCPHQGCLYFGKTSKSSRDLSHTGLHCSVANLANQALASDTKAPVVLAPSPVARVDHLPGGGVMPGEL
ncbi:unnamed protein product [Protopolystoma xenopodis]|uniref:Uncharacterized protein n=1 Tax=Protopolystoma xenopodis TaxID=117903 RepID=A0A448XAR2_9PLAT|nr:unnamed protein product [Protopolystoma xenopodis]